jgi:hypothetical protein
MLRVHDGLPLRGLPLTVPEPRQAPVATAAPAPAPAAPRGGVDATVRSVFDSVLRGLFGSN